MNQVPRNEYERVCCELTDTKERNEELETIIRKLIERRMPTKDVLIVPDIMVESMREAFGDAVRIVAVSDTLLSTIPERADVRLLRT